MFPSIKEALEELEIARNLNPGPWVDHSRNVGIAARNIAEKISDMDSEKAYIVGLYMISEEDVSLVLWIFQPMFMKGTCTAWKKDGMSLPGFA